MSKVLLREYYKLCPNGICEDLLTESEKREIKEEGAIYLTGVFQRANSKNGNGRIYPKHILEREVSNYQRMIKEKRCGGQLDHPDTEIVELQNVSHKIVSLWWNGDEVMGKLKVVDTPQGRTLKTLIKEDFAIGVSSRGIGSIRETNDGIIVEDDFVLLTFDAVSDPSTVGAFMKLTESQVRKIEEKFGINSNTKTQKINQLLDDILKVSK